MQVKGIRLGGVYKGDYTVFSDGRIYSNKSGKYLKHDTSHSKNGLPYHRVTLCQNGHTKRFMVSRLVARLFVANPMNKPQVDHIDGDISDDRVENLRIVTQRANTSTCFRSDEDSLSSEYAGVYWNKNTSKWMARIYHEGVRLYLGLFKTELEAHNAYQKYIK